jgi:uncharacterized protein (DUF2252 family)
MAKRIAVSPATRSPHPEPPPPPLPQAYASAELIAAGKRLREKVSRESHVAWRAPANRADPLAILKAADATRLAELVPVRYGRMLASPFTFYRGSAAVMAADLASTPVSGLHVQACGDAHLLNFGGFATPERRIVFDVNDLDETLPAPWEWDVKRLVASFVLAARSNGLSDAVGRDCARACARSYRQRMRTFATMDVLQIWYASIDADDVLAMVPPARRAAVSKRIAKATERSGSEMVFPKLVHHVGEEPRIRDNPPLIFHPDEARSAGYMEMIRASLNAYRETLPEDRRVLYDRLHLVDIAVKAVGIGSVGTMCAVVLCMTTAGRPFFLQIKEANASVLEPYAGASAYPHHGQRVVIGQRLMQSASDIFLGWVTGPKGRHFYIRQLRDAKLSALVETFDAEMLTVYAKLCGWALARAHAKAGDPWTIGGYLGKGGAFDAAMAKFALAYADQAERDHAALKAAVAAGTVDVLLER